MTKVVQVLSREVPTLAMIRARITSVTNHRLATSVVLSAILCAVVLCPPAYAIDVRSGDTWTLPVDTTIDDTLIVMGDSITIHGMIKGDLIALGRQVTITGYVTGDVITCARRLDVSGSVGGNVFGVAQNLDTTGEVARNFYGVGNTIVIGSGGRVGGNAATVSESMVVDGQVGMDLLAVAGSLDGSGEIFRNVAFRGRQISFLAPMHIGGALSAHVGANDQVRIEPGVIINGARDIQLQEPGPSKYSRISFYVFQLLRLAAAFLTGLILFWMFPGLASGSLAIGREWLRAGSIGFMAMIIVPIAALIVAITLIGLPIAFTAFALWIVGLYLSKIMVAEFVGRSIFKVGRVVPLLMGLVLVLIAVNIPYLGGLINLLMMFLGFGALLLVSYRRFHSAQPA